MGAAPARDLPCIVHAGQSEVSPNKCPVQPLCVHQTDRTAGTMYQDINPGQCDRKDDRGPGSALNILCYPTTNLPAAKQSPLCLSCYALTLARRRNSTRRPKISSRPRRCDALARKFTGFVLDKSERKPPPRRDSERTLTPLSAG